MARIDPTKTEIWRVDIIESEAGWGQKINERVFFDNWEEARDHKNKFNNDQPKSDVVPSIYWFATGPFKVI